MEDATENKKDVGIFKTENIKVLQEVHTLVLLSIFIKLVYEIFKIIVVLYMQNSILYNFDIEINMYDN